MSTTAEAVFDRVPHPKLDVELSKVSEPNDDRLYSAQGRVGVWRYNARMALCILAWLAGGVIAFMGVSTESGAIMAITMVPALVMVVAASVATIYTAIKRLHDIDLSGWYYLLTLVPLVGVIWSLYYALKPGSEDDNQFGAQREATRADKILGALGIFLVISVNILYLIPMGD